MRIHYYLDIDENKKIKCRKCGQVVCDASENYKENVPMVEILPDEIPGMRPSSKDKALVVYYEYYCPGCFTLLDVEVAEKGAPPLRDIQIEI